jgi:ppGpp synthetase/RelA/SpoT-type nucleotidyltranferase
MDSPKIATKIVQLIRQHFPWGEGDCPARPTNDDPSVVEKSATGWIKNRVNSTSLESTALALHARIQDVIEEMPNRLPPTERSRFFYRPDLTHLMKSPESILDKIARSWEQDKDKAPTVPFNNFLARMDDLARFRMVLNFLSDVEMVCRKLEEPYRVSAEERSRLTSKQQALYSDFALLNCCLEDLIMLGPEKRFSGERCRKGLFSLRKDDRIRVEVQIQTMLQEAWDKKDHFLVYERERRGDVVEESHSIEIYAMSELLYVADLTFDRLLDRIRKRRSGGEGN